MTVFVNNRKETVTKREMWCLLGYGAKTEGKREREREKRSFGQRTRKDYEAEKGS